MRHRAYLVVLVAGAAACVPELGNLEDKACTSAGACAAGYRCEADSWLCVPGDDDAGIPADDGGPTDAGLPDGGEPDGGAHDGGAADAGASDGGGPDACVPAEEICNGIDDDCDGVTDFPDPPFDYVAPTLVFLVPTATGPRELVTTLYAEVRKITDPRGALSGPVRWFSNTREGVLGSGPTLAVGPVGSGAPVELGPGRHRLLATFTDGCGASAEAAVDLNVGTPISSGAEEILQAVCVSPQGVVWTAGAGGVTTHTDDLTIRSNQATGDGQACAVDFVERGLVGRDGDNEKVRRFSDPADLSQKADVEVESAPKYALLRGMARDGQGRIWMVGDGILKVLEPTDDRFRAVAGLTTPPDGGYVSCLTYDGSGGLWVCSSLGVNRLDVASPDLPAAHWWRPRSVALFESVSVGNRATALAANDEILWALTPGVQVGNRLSRLDLAALVCTDDGCDPADWIDVVELGERVPITNDQWNDLAVWRDGDVFLGTSDGWVRLQVPLPWSQVQDPIMVQPLGRGRVRDFAVRGQEPWSLYVATDLGLVRYRGE